jgi:hypothetical protein
VAAPESERLRKGGRRGYARLSAITSLRTTAASSFRGARWPLSSAVGSRRSHRRFRADRPQNLLGRHLEAIAVVAVNMNAVNPDVVIEHFAVLHPKLVVEVRRLPQCPSMRGVVAPRLRLSSRHTFCLSVTRTPAPERLS